MGAVLKLLRVFKFWNYIRYTKMLLFRLRARPVEEYVREERQKFATRGWDYDQALHRLNEILQRRLQRSFDVKSDSSHWLVFTALSLKNPNIERILEFGTFNGFFTSLLTELFPKAQVTTVDLPASDPLLKAYFRRDNPEVLREYLQTQKKNLSSSDRIRLVSVNSLFLLEALRDQIFDLIWVDGGHVYPEVAVDLANAYALCREGGLIFCDDVMLAPKGYNDGFVSLESNDVLEYLGQRTGAPVTHFRKRCGAEYSDYFWKYVSMIEKKKYQPSPAPL